MEKLTLNQLRNNACDAHHKWKMNDQIRISYEIDKDLAKVEIQKAHEIKKKEEEKRLESNKINLMDELSKSYNQTNETADLIMKKLEEKYDRANKNYEYYEKLCQPLLLDKHHKHLLALKQEDIEKKEFEKRVKEDNRISNIKYQQEKERQEKMRQESKSLILIDEFRESYNKMANEILELEGKIYILKQEKYKKGIQIHNEYKQQRRIKYEKKSK